MLSASGWSGQLAAQAALPPRSVTAVPPVIPKGDAPIAETPTLPVEAPVPQTPPLRVTPPPGFDNLGGPVETFFDVIYLNRRIGSFRAIVSDGTIHFADPAAVATALGTSVDNARLIAFLTQPLTLNEDRVCRADQTDCGFLSVGASGVIVDVETFTLSLLLGREFLIASQVAVEELGPATSGPSFIQNMLISASATTNRSGALRYGGTFDSYASIGRTSIVAQHGLDDQQGLRIQSGYGQHIWDNKIAAAGLFSNFDSLLLDSYRLLGAQFRSLDRSRNVEGQMALPIEIVLPRSSVIELYRDGVLLNSRRYAGGLQLLDTSTLPTGSYSLRIVARDGAATLLDETRTFVKVADLPAPGEFRFAFRAGTRVDDSFSRAFSSSAQPYFPRVMDQAVGQAQAATRLSAATAVSASVLSIGSRFYSEGSFSGFVGRVRGTASAAVGSDGSYGAFLTSSWILPNISFNLTAKSVHSKRDLFGVPANDPRRFDYYAFIRSEDSILGSTQFRLLGGSLSLSSSYTRSPLLDDRYAFTTRYSRLVRIGRLGSGSVSAYGLASNIEQRVGISFSFFSRIDSRTTLSYGGGGEYVSKSSGSLRRGLSPVLRAVATRRGRVGPVDLTTQAGVLTDSSSDRLFADATGNSAYGSADVAVQYERGRAGASYGSMQLNGQTGFVIGGGGVKLGMRQPGEAFAIVDIDADSKNVKSSGGYRVNVDGQPYDYVPTGSTAAVGLESLSNYRIGLEPEDAPPYEIDLGERRITLYPGNVVRLKWKAERSLSVFGQAIEIDGKPLSGARVRAGTDIVVADDSGYFTVTATPGTRLEIRRTDGTDCTSSLIADLVPENTKSGLIERIGAIRCGADKNQRQVPRSASPASDASTTGSSVIRPVSLYRGPVEQKSYYDPPVKALILLARADLAALDRAINSGVVSPISI